MLTELHRLLLYNIITGIPISRSRAGKCLVPQAVPLQLDGAESVQPSEKLYCGLPSVLGGPITEVFIS